MRWDFLIVWFSSLGSVLRRRGREPITECLNCHEPLAETDSYCASCGQKAQRSTITIWQLIGELFSTLFNLDGRIWHSIRGIFRPGYIARQFIAGRRKSYVNPMRFFLVAMVITFALLNAIINTDDIAKFGDKDRKVIAESEIYADYIALKDSLQLSDPALSAIDTALFRGVKLPKDDTISLNLKILQTNLKDYPMLRKDVYEMPINDLLDKYEVEGTLPKIVISQYTRGRRDLPGATKFIMGNMIWGVVSTIFLLAFLMKFLYLRKKRYYVEHAVVLFDIHSFFFILLSILFGYYLACGAELDGGPIGIIVIATFIYGLWTFGAYYRQGWFKTFVKYLVVLFAYTLFVSFSFILVLLISILFFH